MVNKLANSLPQYKVPEVLCTKVSNGLFQKNFQTGWWGVEYIDFSGIVACQVPASYQPLATNKLLLALFSLFTNAITQLAQLQLYRYSYSDIT